VSDGIKDERIGAAWALTDVWLNKVDPRNAPRFNPFLNKGHNVQRKVRFTRKTRTVISGNQNKYNQTSQLASNHESCLKPAALATLMRLMYDRNDNQPGRLVVRLQPVID
jgi:hypothetical protein